MASRYLTLFLHKITNLGCRIRAIRPTRPAGFTDSARLCMGCLREEGEEHGDEKESRHGDSALFYVLLTTVRTPHLSNDLFLAARRR